MDSENPIKNGIISGNAEFGETVQAAPVCEIEETNVKSIIVRFIGLYSSPESRIHYVMPYIVPKLEGVIAENFSNCETPELRFFSPENISDEMTMINPCHTDAMSKFNHVFLR